MPDKVISGRRLQEVAPGEYAPEVYTRSIWDAAVNRGIAFVATSDRITTTLTNTHINALVENPAGSGHVVTIAQVVANIAPDTMVLGTIVLNPTGNLPTDERTPLNIKALAGGTDASVARFFCSRSTDAMTGGTVTETNLAAHKGRTQIPIGMPLAPGTSVGVSIPLGVVSEGDGEFGVYLTQEPLG